MVLNWTLNDPIKLCIDEDQFQEGGQGAFHTEGRPFIPSKMAIPFGPELFWRVAKMRD
jgi:hypothetical protein